MQWISVSHLIAGIICYCIQLATSARLPDIYWNSTNPIFRIDNTDHIIDVNRGNNKFEYDQVNLICPSYPKGTKEEDSEAYIIYNVSKEEYDTCTVNNDARIIAKCDSPQQIKYFTITFRSFTPQPGGLEFHPGKDYYFITTSTGDTSPNGLNNKIGGRCKSAHMKVTFKVCCGSNTQATSSNSNNNNQLQQRQSTPLSSSSSSPFSSLPANSNVSTSTVNTNSSLMSPHISPLTATGSQGTPVPMQSSEPSRVYASSTVEPLLKTEFRIPSATFSSTQDITMHTFPAGTVGNTRIHHPHPSRGHFSGQTIPNNSPSLSNSNTPSWWKPRPSNKPDAFIPDTSTPSGAGGGHRKGRAWLLIVAAGIAVGVACLIVCFLGVGRRLFIREKHKQSTVINYSI